MWSERARVDYALQRRSTLSSLYTGLTTTTDVCDPDPYTLRAAKHQGEATDRPCPVCRRETLVELYYTFGDELGQYSGRLKTRAELEPMAREHAEFSVYVVEVCTDCGWNHLVVSFVLGDEVPRQRSRRRRASE